MKTLLSLLKSDAELVRAYPAFSRRSMPGSREMPLSSNRNFPVRAGREAPLEHAAVLVLPSASAARAGAVVCLSVNQPCRY